MNTITNGTRILRAVQVEYHPIGPRSLSDSIRLEPQLLYGPTRQHLDAGAGLLWWGRFSVNDRVALTVYAGRGARLRLEILDLEYRVLAEHSNDGSAPRVHALVRQSGPVFFRVRNEGARGEPVLLQVAAGRAIASLAPSHEGGLLRRLLGSVRVLLA